MELKGIWKGQEFYSAPLHIEEGNGVFNVIEVKEHECFVAQRTKLSPGRGWVSSPDDFKVLLKKDGWDGLYEL